MDTAPIALVFDLDGVIREFGPDSPDASIESALGLPPGSVRATAFRPALLGPTITGRQTFDEWTEGICAALAEDSGHPPARVREEMQAWRAHRGQTRPRTVAHLEALRAAGRHTFIFTNGTDLVPAELRLLGVADLVRGVLNSAELGFAKPDPRAYAAAHLALEAILGHAVPRERVWFTDDSPANVAAAREFGWDAAVFTDELIS